MKRAFLFFEIFTVTSLIIMALADLGFFIWGGSGETLSYQFWVFSKSYPVVPFALGFVAGHLVWQYSPDSIKPS